MIRFWERRKNYLKCIAGPTLKAMPQTLLIILIGWSTSQAAQADTFDHSQWNQLLERHVIPLHTNPTTEVDYVGMAHDRSLLKRYLEHLSKVSQNEFELWSIDEQLAFLINVYNAATVEIVLTGFPDIESIKDIVNFFNSPFKKEFISLFGEIISLDDIEKGLILGSDRYNEPRVHFALNCASIGCPALRPQAYRGDRLHLQLEEQTKSFLSDKTRNYLDGQTLRVSSLFKWYRSDFEERWPDIHSLGELFARYASSLHLSEANAKDLLSGKIKIRYLDYDWHLNSKKE